MDFDEYEYLEKTVENPEPSKRKEKENGGGGGARKSAERERSRSSKHRSDEKEEDYDDDDDGNHLKGSKSRYETRDGDRRKEKGLSRHRSRSRDEVRDRYKSSRKQKDRERGRDMYREERNSRDKDSDRDQECDYDKDRRGQERDHDKKGRERECDHDKGRREQECDGKREKENDKEKERELSYRSGSRSRSERHHSDRDERESSREQELREREKERDIRDRDKEIRRHKEKKNDVAEPEADPERDQRAVFAYQISLKADERDVYEFFSRAGRVRDVRLIMDRNSRRSKGVGYIEFYDVMTVPMAIALSGQLLLGQPVMVKPSEAEKNLVQSTIAVAGASGGLTGPYSGGARRLYVGNLHSNMTEDQLRQVFEPFGSVELVQLPLDESGHCKGFGFVQFSRLEDARNALFLNGQLEIAGWVIKVSAVTDQTGMQDIGANTGDFDDDEGGGLSLNAQSRALLMQKLDRGGSTSGITSSLGTSVINSMGLTLPVAPALGVSPAVSSLVPALLQGSVPTLPGQLAANLPVPTAHITTINTIGGSEFVLLKNMFDPKNETYDNFDADIREDVEGECSKFGKLKHIYVDKNSAGFVYLRFENTEAAKSAQRALHGRWFAGKMITATFLTPQTYEFKFPDSR